MEIFLTVPYSHYDMLIGLTGNIATGKSTVFQEFLNREKIIGFNADEVVSDLYKTENVISSLTDSLGTEILTKSGEIDRRKVRTLFLSDLSVRPLLENLFHPMVRSRYEELCQSLQSDQSLIAEIPLLFEKEMPYEFETTIVVACSPETQLQRLLKRSKLDRNTAEKMIKKQVALERKVSMSDYVLWNEGGLPQLQRQINTLNHHLFT